MVKQTGRSLLEMLMMLAIVAILSIAAIVVFTISMDKQRANDLAEAGQRRAIVVSTQINLYEKEPNLDEFTDNEMPGGTFGKTVVLLDDQFGIPVFYVRKRVCQNLLNMIGQGTILSSLSLTTSPSEPISACEEEIGNYLMIYDNDAKGIVSNSSGDPIEPPEPSEPTTPIEPDPPCDSDLVLITNCDGTTSKCCPDGGHSCVSPTDCCNDVSECTGSGKACINNECRCPDAWFTNKNGNCTDCSNYASKEPVSEESCLNCINFGYQRRMEVQKGKNVCVLVDYTCPEGAIRGYSGTDIICRSCSDPQSFTPTSVEDCNNCPNRELFGDSCAPKCQSGSFRGSDKSCIDCSDPNKIVPNNEDECAACPGREMKDGYCVMKECSSGYFQRVDGSCTTCATSGNFEVESAEECAKCPGRIFAATTTGGKKNICGKCPFGQYYQTDYMTCRSCQGTTDNHYSSAEACAACDDTPWPRHIVGSSRCGMKNCPDGYFKGSDGFCRDCSDTGSYDLYEGEECSKCDGTANPRKVIADGKCAPTSCPDGWYYSANGNCMVCSIAKNIIPNNEAECLKCNTGNYTRREMVAGYCVKEASVPDCSDGFYVVNESGIWCKACDSGIMTTTEDECSKCSGRQMKGDKCVKACTAGTTFLNSAGNCISCTTGTAIADAYDADECNSCGNRKIASDGKCVKDCGNTQYLKSDGSCAPCNNYERQLAYNESECTSCTDSTRYLREYKKADGGDGKMYCVQGGGGTDGKSCPSGYFRNRNLNCTRCDDAGASSKETFRYECEKCTSHRYFDNSSTDPNAVGKCKYTAS